MLESARYILDYMDGVTFADFQSNREKRDAVALRLSVIGEAARHISRTTEAALPSIPFREIRGMRNRITHDYGQVDCRIMWEVTQRDLKPLVATLESHFARSKPEP
jgi:uncharacterized protein with HEPN domain